MNLRSTRIVPILTLLALLLFSSSTAASMCGTRLEVVIGQVDVIFTGTVITHNSPHRGGTIVDHGSHVFLFQVDKVYKGDPADTIAVRTSQGVPGPFFEIGEDYVVLAEYRYAGRLWVGGCSFSGDLEGAKRVLVALEDLPATGPTEFVDRALVEAAISRLEADAESVRVEAARHLGWLGKRPDLAIPALQELLTTGTPRAQGAAAFALSRFEDQVAQVTPSLTSALEDSSGSVRFRALDALFRLIPTKDVEARRALLLSSLGDPEDGVRGFALREWRQDDFEPEIGLPLLERALQDTAAYVRSQALRQVRRYGTEAVSLLPSVKVALSDTSARVREDAVATLASIAPTDPATETTLRQAWRDSDPRVRRDVLGAFRGIAKQTGDYEPLLDHLRLGIEDPDENVRLETLSIVAHEDSLHVMSHTGRVVERAFDDPSPLVRQEALDLFGSCCGCAGGSLAVEVVGLTDHFLGALDDTCAAVRASAIRGLAKLESAEVAVPALMTMTADSSWDVRRDALNWLSHIGSLQETIPYLERALHDPHENVRIRALSLLAHRLEAEESWPRIVAALADSSHPVRRSALHRLTQTGSPEEALPHLVVALDDPDDWVRLVAAESLADLGETAMLSLPKLNEMLATERYANRVVIRQAIRKIRGAEEPR